MEYWIVTTTKKDGGFSLEGIFDSKNKAVAACSVENTCVAGPMPMNEILPDKYQAKEVLWPRNIEFDISFTAAGDSSGAIKMQ